MDIDIRSVKSTKMHGGIKVRIKAYPTFLRINGRQKAVAAKWNATWIIFFHEKHKFTKK